MSAPEKSLFDLTDIPTVSSSEKLAAYPQIHVAEDSFDTRRRKLAEEREGEPVALVPNVGYVAVSKLTEYRPAAE